MNNGAYARQVYYEGAQDNVAAAQRAELARHGGSIVRYGQQQPYTYQPPAQPRSAPLEPSNYLTIEERAKYVKAFDQLNDALEDRGKRPYNGLAGRFRTPKFTIDQLWFTKPLTYNPDTIKTDYVNAFKEGRKLFPIGGGFPRLERLYHEGKDKQGNPIVDIFPPKQEDQKGGARRRTRRGRKRSQRRRRRTACR